MIYSLTKNTHKSIELIPIIILSQIIIPREKYTKHFEIKVLVASSTSIQMNFVCFAISLSSYYMFQPFIKWFITYLKATLIAISRL
jgi:hypothetical protein